MFKRLGSINRALEKIGFRVEESNALGVVSTAHAQPDRDAVAWLAI